MSLQAHNTNNRPSRFYSDTDERRAGMWAYQQVKLYIAGKLSQEKIDMLNATEGWSWELEM